jgi:hypothetical protein
MTMEVETKTRLETKIRWPVKKKKASGIDDSMNKTVRSYIY